MNKKITTIVTGTGASIAGSSMVFLSGNPYNTGMLIPLAFGLSIFVSGCISLLKKWALCSFFIYPIAPSNSKLIKLFISTAYSTGNSFEIG